MRLKYFVNGLLAALFTAILVMAPAVAQTPQSVLKSGTVFHFEGENRINGAKAQFMVRIDSVNPFGATRIAAGEADRPSPDVAYDLPMPLVVGKAWEYTYQFDRQWRGKMSTYQYNGKAVVVAEESLTISGQVVKVLRVDSKGTMTRSVDGYKWDKEDTRWFAPEIGYVVKYVGTETDKGKTIFDYTSAVVKIALPSEAQGTAPAPAAPVTTAAADPAVTVPIK